MVDEKRRYFRINETIGLYFEVLEDSADSKNEKRLDIWDFMTEQDDLIERLLNEAEAESPKLAALIRAFNQKIERLSSQLIVESRNLDRLANRVKEVNISACGIGFISDREIPTHARLAMELQLFPEPHKVKTKGRVIACDASDDGFYWRVDFYDMSQASQERLIQHIVQRQSIQLKELRS